MKRFLVLFLAFSSFAAAQKPTGGRWTDWQPFMGKWQATGEGDPGQALGEFSFQPELQGAVLARHSYAEYHASKDKPAYRHDDLMLIYSDPSSNSLRADYWDYEGHIIHYKVELSSEKLVFRTDEAIPGPQFRITARYAAADSVDDFIRQQMKEKHIPGAVLIELKDGKIVKEQAYGVANAELNVPMRTDNVFLVASVTKVFVTTGVFLLIQDGKLHLDDKITQIVPGLPASWSDITVLNCLSHTSGIPEIVRYRSGGFQWLASTQEEALKLLSSIPLEHKPGEKSGYNGTEFLIIKMIVEKVSGMRLQDFLAKRIFAPLGLESARYGDTLDIIPNRVSFYTSYTPLVDRSVAFDRWDELLVSDSKIWNYRVPYPEWLYGAAGLNISALDLAKFDAALTQGKLLNKRLLEQMWTPYRLTNGEMGRFTAGWMTRMWNGHKLVFHLGGDLVIYARLPDEGISVIWLTNLDPSNPYDVMSGILQRDSH